MIVSALNLTGDLKMKYEYLKGSEKDFEGAPEWAHQVIKSTSIYGYAFVDEFDYMCKYQARENPCDIGNIVNPSVWKVIAERRPITEPSWNGAGLPPVGCECEVLYDTVRDEWFLAKIIGHDNGSVVGRWLNGDGLYSLFDYSHASCSFRPIRTEADKKRDAVIESLMRIVCGPSQASATVNKIYDAIASSKIHGVKLED